MTSSNIIGVLITVVFLALALAGYADAPNAVSVQVKSSKLRGEPKHWSGSVADLQYGDRLEVISKQGGWYKVKSSNQQEGFVHESAVTTKKVVISSAAEGIDMTKAEDSDLVLAGKGFNKDAEATLASQKPDLNFRAVDELEHKKVREEDLKSFIESGKLNSNP